jgi:hypothetical protein
VHQFPSGTFKATSSSGNVPPISTVYRGRLGDVFLHDSNIIGRIRRLGRIATPVAWPHVIHSHLSHRNYRSTPADCSKHAH